MILCLTIFYTESGQAQHFDYPKENPVELGKVAWIRNFDKAQNLAKQKQLPILILFQEVPGCSNCTNFGKNILSHPLIAEAVETHFVPLCIYNNAGGHDRDILKKFNEPSWNNPVIRITDSHGQDMAERNADFGSKTKFIANMLQGIRTSGQEIPEYLNLLLEEVESKESGFQEEVYFSMYCFWSGEKTISGMPGVIQTEAGYMYGKEVVKVTYRKDKTTLKSL